MSEKLYAWLLCLFPYQFRETYGNAALQLFRDRSRDEKGFFLSLRLWLDLITDLATSIPREYRYHQPAFHPPFSAAHLNGTSSFRVLEGESLRVGSLFLGGVLSLVALAAFSVLNSHVGTYRTLRASVAHDQGQAYGRWSALSRCALPTGDDAEGMKLDPGERQRVIDAVTKNLKQHYVDPDVAQKIADTLLAHERRGDYDAATDGSTFADLLTRQIRDQSHDMHLEVVYSQVPLPDRPLGPTPEVLARYRKALEQDNCTFRNIEILPHNIGYLKLDAFPDPSMCQSTATAAMVSLNQVNAIIFDLRDNGGGSSMMVSLIAAYLFDHPEYMYDPRVSPNQQSWTPSPVPGNRLADKPAYVLTSASTVSAAEQFAYDLKMLKRVTLVGETTRGSAHAGVWHRIDDHFGMGIPETRAINPYSKTDWEGTGVVPDVKVKAADAFKTAEKLAESKLQER